MKWVTLAPTNNGKRRRTRGYSDGDGCPKEEKERKTEAEVDVSTNHDLTEKGLSCEEP